VITAVVEGGMTQAEAVRTYGVSKGWVSRLLARYRAEGEAAFEPKSRRPKTSPTAISEEVVEQLVRLRKDLQGAGLDAGPHTIAWHLAHLHGVRVSAATISRYLGARGLVVPEPKKKPKSAFLTFAAEQPNERWQSDFTHYRLSRPDGRPGADTEILSWLDDHARYALPALRRIAHGDFAEHRVDVRPFCLRVLDGGEEPLSVDLLREAPVPLHTGWGPVAGPPRHLAGGGHPLLDALAQVDGGPHGLGIGRDLRNW
jgi:transposase